MILAGVELPTREPLRRKCQLRKRGMEFVVGEWHLPGDSFKILCLPGEREAQSRVLWRQDTARTQLQFAVNPLGLIRF